MDSAQRVREILKDETQKKEYQHYQNSEAEHKKRMQKVYLLAVIIVLVGVVPFYIIMKEMGLIALAPLGIIALIVCHVIKKNDHKKVENAWELHVKDTLLQVIRAFFPDAKYQRKASRKKVLYHFFKPNKIKCRNQIRATWKGKTFYAYEAELIRSSDSSKTTLFHGQVINVAVEKNYDMHLSAQMKKDDYMVFLPKWKKDMGDLLEMRRASTKEVLTRAWLKELAGDSCPLICAEIKGVVESQVVEVGLGDEFFIPQAKPEVSYEDYVNSVNDGMIKLKAKLEKIMTNGKLYRMDGE